ncbi:PepSY-associated TM helix domain-containing protein [Aurantiacibacter poecillastricola]|uniref:PepSY-associated TM helix domain-containing protein n=1 Tax=Aurantiacibacter poecillastricola TaxID=3064385 RepID=UPI00273DB397|nr:PepSY-associated TM helix domain-containing protein [Aurantiacibacter sp. 219JJ12-13]MDP5263071.1 PepSY-associated TM helix domain-containing protein [Aurantiacibacter sp. 219JJ12-13]
MKRSTIKAWFVVHKWSSLVSTLFLLMLCVTGLPLIFHDEIDAIVGEDYEVMLDGEPSAEGGRPLDRMLDLALAERPGEVPLFMAFSQQSPLLTVTTGPTPDADGSEMTLLFLDRTTGEVLGPAPSGGFMEFVLQLHTDMFLGLPGMLFLGVMGGLFVIALVSGVVLYAPFMRRLPFGTLRTSRSTRVKTLDQHNLLGIVALGWTLVVGSTGVINAFADPLVDNWRGGELAEMTAQYAGEDPLDPAGYGSLDAAMAAAQSALPGRSPQFIGFPGGDWSSGHHYAVFFQGDRPLTQHLLTPALIDARTAELTDARAMPPINQALMMSKPLHFGDYGGLPLKLIWAALTLATIWVLWTGIVLWMRRSPARIERRIDEIASGAARGVAA